MDLFSGGSSQGADSNLYISATKENDLARATLAILHAAKQRSKKSYATGNGNNTTAANKSLNQSHASSSALNPTLKKLNRKSGGLNVSKIPKIGMLPPVVPQSAKNGHDTTLNHSKSMGMGNRSVSASRREVMTPTGRLPLIRLDSEDRKSPEKTLAKISFTMANIEQSKIKEIEVENVQLGAQLNNLNFMIYRKEKEYKQLEEHYTAVMIEHSVNSEGQHKLEVMETKLLRAYEDLNRVEVERKRIEQIVKACAKNPPNNEEQIRNLEQQIDVFVKLISYHQSLMSNAHKEQEQFKKQLVDLQTEIQKLETYQQHQITKVTDIVDRKRRLDLLLMEGDEGRKNFAMHPIESVEIDVGKLKARQQNYKKWKAKLNVTKAFVSEKRLLFESSFRKMIEIAGLRTVETATLLQKENPLQNLEGLIAFIERANDLDKSKRQKEAKIEKLKRDKEELMTELRKWENGIQLIEYGHIERAQKKLYLEDKQFRAVKENQQRQLSLIADLKSGFVNVAKILGIEEGLETESDQTALIERICEKFSKLEHYRNGSKIDLGNGSDTLSADRNDVSNRSSKHIDGDGTNNLLSPQGNRTRKKQPKQAKNSEPVAIQPGGGKASPMAGGNAALIQNASGGLVNASVPMKLGDLRESRDLDSDTEERQQLQQDRLKLKKNLSASGNYTLSKALQPNQVATPSAGGAAAVATADSKDGAGAAKGANSRNHFSVGLKNSFKKNNLTASNPIIGAPLGDKSLSQKQFMKMQAQQQSGATLQFKSKEREGSASKAQNLTMSKPALANSKIPKYVKKTIKFARESGSGGADADGEM
ncbi:hypothetical protein FGO68_gene13217 [Halteria grandinella]|uniref:Uncharacterized protein n=1 Tax=Halteria grandinella TaxID=5974 RepID=A0A8J8NFG4_HALGN|nr:hypothetical protein FGO68_gene13217 [Halteria grandinella]